MTPDQWVVLAIERGLDVDKLEKLLAMQERWMADKRKQAFISAHREFQKEAPQILKTRDGAKLRAKDDNTAPVKASYKFADIAVIADVLKDCLYKWGLSYRWTFRNFIDENKVDKIEVTCVVSHIDGHEEHTTLSNTKEDSGGKNHLQAGGSTLTYLERYTMIGALGLTTLLQDDDGRAAGAGKAQKAQNGPKPPITDQQFVKALERIKSGEDLSDQLHEHYKLTEAQEQALAAFSDAAPLKAAKTRKVSVKPNQNQ